jgi:hypothetical protein
LYVPDQLALGSLDRPARGRHGHIDTCDRPSAFIGYAGGDRDVAQHGFIGDDRIAAFARNLDPLYQPPTDALTASLRAELLLQLALSEAA